MACRFTWLSGLLFDEYRKRQTAEGFTWGTKVPRLSTVVLHHRPQQQQQHNAPRRTNQAANGQSGGDGEHGDSAHDHSVTALTTTRCLRKGAVPAVEQRRLFLRGQVKPGTSCTTCGKGHPAEEHLASGVGMAVAGTTQQTQDNERQCAAAAVGCTHLSNRQCPFSSGFLGQTQACISGTLMNRKQ